jgi:hypothetical protein
VNKLQCLVYPMPTIGRLLGCISIVCLKPVLATHANLLRVAKCWIVALVQAQVTPLKSRTRLNFGADAIYIQSSRGVVVILPELLEHNMVLLKCFDDDTSMILSSCDYKIWIVKELEHDKKLVNTWIVHTHISVGTVNSFKDSDSGQDHKAIYCSFQGAYELSFSTIINNSKEVSSLLHSFASSWNVYHIVAISPTLKSEIDFELKEQPEPHCLPLKHNRCSMILTENIIIFSSNANQLLNCHWVKLHSSAGPLQTLQTSILKKLYLTWVPGGVIYTVYVVMTSRSMVVEAREDDTVDEEVSEDGSNGNAQQLGDKPPFKERGMSGYGLVVGQADRKWASCGPSVTGYRAQEKEYKDEGRQLLWGLKNYQQTYRFIPFFLVKLPSAPSNSPSVLAPIPLNLLPQFM